MTALILESVFALYIGACLFLLLGQTRLIFVPCKRIEATPADLELDYQDIWIPVFSNSPKDEIHGWWIDAPPEAASESKILLYLHGNSGNISSNLNHARRFQQLGFSVFIVDYRGYGRSGKRFPNESRVYQDAETALMYLLHDRQIPPKQIFLYGHSLGGAIAIETAKRHPEIAGLIVQNTFTSMLEAVRSRKIYKIFPLNWLLNQQFNSLEKIKAIALPILFINGTEDTVIPSYMSQQLYQAAPGFKRLYTVPEAGHNNVAAIAGEAYLHQVRQFLEAQS
jgi:uncharacterized protein